MKSSKAALLRALAEGLRQARLAKGASVRELAAQVRLDVSTIHGLERGSFFPSFKNLVRLTEALDVRIELHITPTKT